MQIIQHTIKENLTHVNLDFTKIQLNERVSSHIYIKKDEEKQELNCNKSLLHVIILSKISSQDIIMKINKIVLAQVAALFLVGTLSAKECIDMKSVNIGWTSYKTMAKIGVSGTFKDVKFMPSKNRADIKHALVGTSVKLNMQNIDAKAAIKTNNILKYFVAKLATSKIDAKIVSLDDKRLSLEVNLNNKKQTIPMNYTIDGGVVIAKGFIDARDFGFVDALTNLNTNVAGHQNKGWLDVDISFELVYEDSCR